MINKIDVIDVEYIEEKGELEVLDNDTKEVLFNLYDVPCIKGFPLMGTKAEIIEWLWVTMGDKIISTREAFLESLYWWGWLIHPLRYINH